MSLAAVAAADERLQATLSRIQVLCDSVLAAFGGTLSLASAPHAAPSSLPPASLAAVDQLIASVRGGRVETGVAASDSEASRGEVKRQTKPSSSASAGPTATSAALGKAVATKAASAAQEKKGNSSGGALMVPPEDPSWNPPVVKQTDSANRTRLTALANELGFTNVTFVRAAPDYYSTTLEQRRRFVGAHSVHHMCKSMVYENTKLSAEESVSVPKYFMVVQQYTRKLHSEKFIKHVHQSCGGTVPKRKINMRLAPSDVSVRLTGYDHNAVSPLGALTRLPLVLSHRLLELRDASPDTDYLWLGAGEEDLKVRFSITEFIEIFKPAIVDITYDTDVDTSGVSLDA